jgi:hypothetical protein
MFIHETRRLFGAFHTGITAIADEQGAIYLTAAIEASHMRALQTGV